MSDFSILEDLKQMQQTIVAHGCHPAAAPYQMEAGETYAQALADELKQNGRDIGEVHAGDTFEIQFEGLGPVVIRVH